ncbi:hypothetical protein [Ochrobactrum sp. S1502_03]|uniref:hypothetical protein n=1 Tax=Ochrobactrum sp. S1502_03 TaxID=3108451 RepID=UPI0037C4F52C
MTEDDAIDFMVFMHDRIRGWGIPLSVNPRTGFADFRTKAAKQNNTFLTDMALQHAGFENLVKCIQNGGHYADLYPEPMRDIIRFRADHIVPREWNEPSSPVSIQQRAEYQGLPPLPDWILRYGKPASIADHPPYPEPTDIFKAWDSEPPVPQSNVIPFPMKGAA